MAIGACCTPEGTCVNAETADCIAAFGLPYPPVGSPNATSCADTRQGQGQGPTLPNTYPIICSHGACCDPEVIDRGQPQACFDVTREECVDPFGTITNGIWRGRGTYCGGPDFSNPNNFTFPACPQFLQAIRCCLPDGSENTIIDEAMCDFIEGTTVLLDEQCPPAGPDPDCRLPQPDRLPLGGKHWTLDVCANVPMAPTFRPSSHRTPLTRTRENYAELFTLREARALKPPSGQTICRNYYSQMAIAESGYATPLFCSDHSVEGVRLYEGAFMLSPDGDLTTPGYAIAMSAYDAPLWTEVNLSSPLITCGAPPV